MSRSDYPAGAFDNEDAPFNQKESEVCGHCEGKGEFTFCGLTIDCPHCKGGEMTEEQLRDEYESFKEDTNERRNRD